MIKFKKKLINILLQSFALITVVTTFPAYAYSAENTLAENASGSPVMLLHALKMPDITIINHLAFKTVKVDKSEAVRELNALLSSQFGLTKTDLSPKNLFIRQSHAELAALIQHGNIISAYAIANEIYKLPNASHEKLIESDLRFIKNAIAPSYDNDDTDEALAMARIAIGRIGEPSRRDWHTYIYWSIMGKLFHDDIAVEAGLTGLKQTGDKLITIAIKKELKILDEKVNNKNTKPIIIKGKND